jgi:hypothetical protein
VVYLPEDGLSNLPFRLPFPIGLSALNATAALAVLAALAALLPSPSLAQQETVFKYLAGESELDVSVSPVDADHFHHLDFTEDRWQVFLFDRNDPKSRVLEGAFKVQGDVKIVSAKFKADDPDRIVLLLLDGRVGVFHRVPKAGGFGFVEERSTSGAAAILSNGRKIIGDGLYVLAQGRVNASWDTARTWKMDTAGIGGEIVNDVTVDTSFNAWAITGARRLFFQHRDSSVWRQESSYAATGTGGAVFVDRKGRMFVSSSGEATRVQMSPDGGASWVNVSAGIGETIVSFGDDAMGNVYATGAGAGVYRLSDPALPWVSIGEGLSAQAYLPSGAKVAKAISGDRTLYAATRYGICQSQDSGATWALSQTQSPAHIYYSPVIRTGEHMLISTNLGLHRVAKGDTVWEQTYPPQGHSEGINAVAADSSGVLYGNLPVRTGLATAAFYTQKSIDQGKHWTLDTAGQGELGFNAQALDWSVDGGGNQYLGGAAVFYVKRPGRPWTLDTAGLGMLPGELVRQVSRNNRNGVVYLARKKDSKYAIYARPLEGTAWQPVPSDALGAEDGVLMSDDVGNIVVKVPANPAAIWRYDGAAWTRMALPSVSGTNPNVDLMAMDDQGVLWVSMLASGKPKGIYFTNDGGSTWRFAGLESAKVKFLTSYRDMIYVVTFQDGVYRLSTEFVTGARASGPRPAPFIKAFLNSPNPFRSVTRIRFESPAPGKAEVSVFDLHGRRVAVLMAAQVEAGAHEAVWDAAGFRGGTYFCRLRFLPQGAGEAENATLSRKLMLLD